MIVVGPHVLAHHLLEGDCDNEGDNDINCNAKSCSKAYEHNSGSGNADQHDADKKSYFCDAYSPSLPQPQGETVQIGDDLMHRWRDTRLKLSTALGSIGAPPLTSSIGTQPALIISISSHNKYAHDAANPNKIDGTHLAFQTNLGCILDMATSHTELLQTMNRMIEALRVGTFIHQCFA